MERACTANLHAATDSTRVVLVENLNVEASLLNPTGQLLSIIKGFGYGLVCCTVREMPTKWDGKGQLNVCPLE